MHRLDGDVDPPHDVPLPVVKDDEVGGADADEHSAVDALGVEVDLQGGLLLRGVEVEGWRLEVGGWRLEVGGWRLERLLERRWR